MDKKGNREDHSFEANYGTEPRYEVRSRNTNRNSP